MNPSRDRGFTLIELLIVVTIISILVAVAVPNYIKFRMTGNETSAITSLSAVKNAEVMYAASCGAGGFAVSLTVLGTPVPGTTVAFIGADLGSTASPIKSSYVFTLGPGAGASTGPNDCNGTATQSDYYATAVPQTFGSNGARSFATNASNMTWQVYAAAAPTEPFGPPATPIQ